MTATLKPDGPEHGTCVECGAKVQHNNQSGRASQWDFKRASSAGWFFKRDGTSYCPEHLPEWVDGWRARRAAVTNVTQPVLDRSPGPD